MKETSKIYLIRHGECKANVQDMNLPPDVDVITEKGILQSSLLGKTLENVVFTHAYTSDYSRAIDTAEEILRNLKTPVPELVKDARLREREMGQYENRPMRELFNALFTAARENGTQMLEFEVPGGESVKAMESRTDSFLQEILQLIRDSPEPQTILVVSHGIIMLRMMLKLRFWSKEPERKLVLNSFNAQKLIAHVKNTGYHLLTVETENDNEGSNTVIDITKLHESSHLDPLKPAVPVPPSKDYQEAVNNFAECVKQQCTHV